MLAQGRLVKVQANAQIIPWFFGMAVSMCMEVMTARNASETSTNAASRIRSISGNK